MFFFILSEKFLLLFAKQTNFVDRIARILSSVDGWLSFPSKGYRLRPLLLLHFLCDRRTNYLLRMLTANKHIRRNVLHMPLRFIR